MFRAFSDMLGGAQNLVRSVTNVTGSNALTDSVDKALSSAKSQSDSTSSTIEHAETDVNNIGRAAEDMNDTTKS
ncbi:hypothetical protein [uncultured Rhodospira sp.]|uniref:hypothetical protein n=1 Tax=uncultured Rhodospira sp. TaxID=1936189 RepID=UPI00262810C9|nr:hypothetical protein [uncultured Rhodospira sp.]